MMLRKPTCADCPHTFFFKTEHGYELLFSFDAKTAKKNIREEID